MKKIPKEIVEKVEKRNKFNEEIRAWCQENLEMDGMDSDCADITDHHNGDEQWTEECKEWCEQWTGYLGDDFYGDYYWETECPGKYLHMHFSTY